MSRNPFAPNPITLASVITAMRGRSQKPIVITLSDLAEQHIARVIEDEGSVKAEPAWRIARLNMALNRLERNAGYLVNRTVQAWMDETAGLAWRCTSYLKHVLEVERRTFEKINDARIIRAAMPGAWRPADAILTCPHNQPHCPILAAFFARDDHHEVRTIMRVEQRRSAIGGARLALPSP